MKAGVKWTIVLLVAGMAVGAVTIKYASSRDRQPQQQQAAYKEVIAQRGPFRLAVTASGLVRPIDRIELKSKASGEIVLLKVESGDQVAQGELIAQLDQVDERAALAQAGADLDIARAELTLAEKNHQRRKQLFSSEIIAEEERDQTELNLAIAHGKLIQATTALERAEERMADSVISAPVDGVILQKYVEKGQIIASGVSNVGGGTPIADIANMGTVHIEAGIDEIDIGRIEVGQQATVKAEAYPNQHYSGQVVRIAPEARVEQNVTLFDVVILVENTDGKLKSGMNAEVEIVMVDRSNVLTIPMIALQQGLASEAQIAQSGRPDGHEGTTNAGSGGRGQSGGGGSIVLVRQGDTFQPQPIRVGMTNYQVVEVLAGLSEGDVLGIPMVSRLKSDNDRRVDRVRSSRSFGPSKAQPKKPETSG